MILTTQPTSFEKHPSTSTANRLIGSSGVLAVATVITAVCAKFFEQASLGLTVGSAVCCVLSALAFIGAVYLISRSNEEKKTDDIQEWEEVPSPEVIVEEVVAKPAYDVDLHAEIIKKIASMELEEKKPVPVPTSISAKVKNFVTQHPIQTGLLAAATLTGAYGLYAYLATPAVAGTIISSPTVISTATTMQGPVTILSDLIIEEGGTLTITG